MNTSTKQKTRATPHCGGSIRASGERLCMNSSANSPRVRERPDPQTWEMDELLTVAEAVELHWPNGPITVPTLRTAIRQGQLAVCRIAGKFYLTRRCLLALSAGTIIGEKPRPPEREVRRPSGGMSELEALEFLGSKRTKSPRLDEFGHNSTR
jgi:hypothetical protein